MAENSGIEWTDHTFNPWEGCQKVGPGCDHCYAETRNARFGGGMAPNWGPGAPRRLTSKSNWNKPLHWQANAAAFLAEHGRRQRVFCASLADVFDNAVPEIWRSALFDLIDRTPDLDWLLLTKRIGNVARMTDVAWGTEDWPTNVWLGATIVNQVEADRDIPVLLATAGPRIRFLSMEPLLGPVDLGDLRDGLPSNAWLTRLDALDWVIVGGESGAEARPMHFSWARSLRDQCAAAGVPFLFKQWGEWAPFCSMTEELTESLYRGGDARRRCKVDQLVMHNDGEIFRLSDRSAQIGTGPRLMFQQGFEGMTMFAVGKARAGRLLDGTTHDGVPS